jgi:hypothetical protein
MRVVKENDQISDNSKQNIEATFWGSIVATAQCHSIRTDVPFIHSKVGPSLNRHFVGLAVSADQFILNWTNNL